MFTAKRLLIAVAASAALGSAARADVKVHRAEDDQQSVRRVAFDINERLGRAWVVVTYYWPNAIYSEDSQESDERHLVSGMTYDAEKRVIVFQEAGQAPVVCATVTRKSFLGAKWNSIRSTGRCGITRVSDDSVSKDDGFEVTQKSYKTFYFGVQPEGRQGD